MPDTQIAVRYCGGCSTTYDREAAVKQLQNLLPEYSFVIAEPGKRYACTSTLTLAVPKDRQVSIEGFPDLISARDRLREILSTRQ